MITPNAVPPPAVASGPVLQCVSTRAFLGISSRPCAAMRIVDGDLLRMDRARFGERIGGSQHAVDRPRQD